MQRGKIWRFIPMTLCLILLGQGCVGLGKNNNKTVGEAGMFISTNNAETWTSISLMPTTGGVQKLNQISVFKLITDPQDPKALYWATREAGYLYSYDEGKSWQKPIGAELSTGFVHSLTVNPRDKCNIYGTNSVQTYKSADCGRSWTEVYREARPDVKVVSILFKPDDPSIIYMAMNNGDLMESIDAGFSWRVVNRFKTKLADIFISPASPNVIFVATKDRGLFRSDDSGDSWLSITKENMKDFKGSEKFRRFYFVPNVYGHIYWASEYGLLRSSDNGDSWTSIPLITDTGVAEIWGLAVNPTNEKQIYYTATINTRSTLYKSADGGQSWTTSRLPSGQVPTVLHVVPREGGNVYIYLGFTIPPKK